jgi:[ribosomal protein S5]-alanine N-acetyltransferase
MENRLDLIEFNNDYLDDLYEYSSQEDFYKYMQSNPHKSIEETKKYFLSKTLEANTFLFLVRISKLNKVVGSVIINKFDELNLSANIGYGINPKYWGNGYLSELLSLAEIKAKHEIGIQRIEAVTMNINQSSINGLKRSGYKEVGKIKGYYLFSNKQRYDALLFSKLL